MAAYPYHSGPHVIGTLHCGSCIRNAEEENTRGDKPVRDSLKTVIGKRRDGGRKINRIDTNGKPTHAARQLSSGLWTSKLGKLQDI